MLLAILLVTSISISSLYDGFSELSSYKASGNSDPGQLEALLARTAGIAITLTILIAMLASAIFFRITRPFARKVEQQAETFHTLAKSAHEAIFLIDTRGIIQFMNPAAEALFGYTSEELLGENIKQLMPSPHREKHDSYIANYLKTGIKHIIGTGRQLIGQRKDGSQFPIYLSLGEISLAHAHLFAGLIMDLSTQQRLQREVLAIPAREQQRIGEELHDGLGQQLTGLSMLAQSLLNKATRPEHELARQLASGLNEAMSQVQALSRGMMPIQIYADGFMISLQEITETFQQQSQIPIKLQIDDFVLLFDDATATHLYRIVQESLNNAVKHADASQIDVSLKVEGDHGLLEIADDGIGIATGMEGTAGGLGLSIMKHRCGLFDGEITINPAGERGTKVSCRFPLTQRRESH
jgi:two-component system, LuxR family, sensor kinase FixL